MSGGRRTVALALVVAAMAAACTSENTVTGTRRSAANATDAPLLPRTVDALPSLDFDRYERLLYELRGTPVVVNLWASWCGPCRTETPAFVAAAQRCGDRVQFLGVDYQDQRSGAVDFIDRYDVPYPSVMDAGEIHDRLGFVGLPDTVFYAADGSIASTWSGPITADALTERLDGLIGSGGASCSTR
jgi:cytochrome c biogenesis protein CcmG, thiol:disulfide interchange protein DsbE